MLAVDDVAGQELLRVLYQTIARREPKSLPVTFLPLFDKAMQPLLLVSHLMEQGIDQNLDSLQGEDLCQLITDEVLAKPLII